MKDDTISRRGAIKTIKDALLSWSNMPEWRENKIVGALEKLPPAQQWIPCSERLPKPNEYANGVQKYYLVQNEYGDMMVCSFHGCWWMQMYRHIHVGDKVVAWMPLPKPWKGEEK